MFHLKDGLFFEREAGGDVRVIVVEDGDSDFPPPFGHAKVLFETKVNVDGLASVVASMSARGENADTWKEAVEYLGRRSAAAPVPQPPAGEVKT